jgi:hypothetical protein
MEKSEAQGRWVDIVALFLSAIGALAAIAGAVLIGFSQAQAGGSTVWPLPGLVLLDWAILGAAGACIAFLTAQSMSVKWVNAYWLITGAFIPLIILGILSIGLYVLITYVLYLISAIILSVRRHPKWLNCFGIFMLGVLGNLGILLLFISLGNLSG